MFQSVGFQTPSGWRWQCHHCGWSLSNTNQDKKCTECGTKMRCISGHSDFDGDGMCDNGCGYNFKTGKTELDKRRKDY